MITQLPKGESMTFLDYTIKHCSNGDGMVLMKPGAIGYECHLGNYGDGMDEMQLDNVKKAAVLFYMIARPEVFATCLMQKIMDGSNHGTYREMGLLKQQLKKEGLELPEEITEGEGINALIYYKGEPFKWGRK